MVKIGIIGIVSVGMKGTMNIRELIEVDLEKMSGTPCFTGTRVPVSHLFDYLEVGDSVGEFLNDFPTVTRRTGAWRLRADARPNPHRI